MDRHFLIAVSNQKSAIFGIRFVADFFTDKSLIKSTLFYSTPKPPAVWEEEKTLQTELQQKDKEQKIARESLQTLESAKKESVLMGLLPENIDLKVQPQEFSKVGDIIHEGEKGSYDAVVLGRRGLSMIEEAFEDSVSRSIFNDKFTFPLWLCRSSDPSRQNVLLYVDGSPSSFQMADHVGFVLALEDRHRVDLMISSSLSDDSPEIDRYVEILKSHGLPEDRFQVRWKEEINPARQILKILDKEPYAAVALGRTGKEPNLLARLFRGPVCSVLFSELDRAALWLCP
ncbi:MAG: hypothetical protein D3926_01385 [Desulfobacteraceae bacterium]|nr:MAG: hypothetical protein D3926_01385 [Desulfobacteraceae bacterium]